MFHPAPELEDEDVAQLVHTMRDRIVRLLRRRDLWPRASEECALDEREPAALLPFLAAASIQGRIALGPDAGRRIERLGHGPSDAPCFEPGELCAAIDGFSLHAQVHVEAGDRERLEHLCRYVCRPALASERLSLDERGRVLLELRHPWRDGTTHIVFESLVFLERLAALVPRPREHQLTYHGVLAPASSWRDLVVPVAAAERSGGAVASDLRSDSDHPATSVPESTVGDTIDDTSAPLPAPCASSSSSSRYSWTDLLRRVFGIDVLRCPACGSRRRLIALITDPGVVRRILRHLELPSEPPPVAAARPPPQMALEF